MGRVTDFGTGTKVLLVSGLLLLISLFLTWQSIQVKFGKNGTVTQSLDGWDFWGLVIALATLAVIVLAVMREQDDGLAFEPRVSRVVLGLGCLVLLAAVLKNFRDADSAWASYLGVILAGAVAVGAYLDFAHEREPRATAVEWRPRDRTLERSSSSSSAAEQPKPRW
jgi:hypothetical protein